MNKQWTEDVIGTKKPIIAMCHLNPLPGDPYYNPTTGMKDVVEWARKDFLALQNGGVVLSQDIISTPGANLDSSKIEQDRYSIADRIINCR